MSTAIELAPLPRSHTTSEQLISIDIEDASSGHDALPPVDRGKDAWLVLASAFLLEALVWGESVRCGFS